MSSYGMFSNHYDAIPCRGQAPRVYRGDVSNENPDSVNFPVDGFQRRRVPDAGPRGTERKRNAELSRSLAAARNSLRLSPDPRTPTRNVQNYC